MYQSKITNVKTPQLIYYKQKLPVFYIHMCIVKSYILGMGVTLIKNQKSILITDICCILDGRYVQYSSCTQATWAFLYIP